MNSNNEKMTENDKGNMCKETKKCKIRNIISTTFMNEKGKGYSAGCNYNN